MGIKKRNLSVDKPKTRLVKRKLQRNLDIAELENQMQLVKREHSDFLEIQLYKLEDRVFELEQRLKMNFHQ